MSSTVSPGAEPGRLLLFGILAVAALLRLTFLDAFPEVQADEGLWTNSTKNFLRFGDWFMDGRKHVLLSPVFHALSVVSFSILGPSIEAARVVSAVAGTASVYLLYRIVQHVSGDVRLALYSALLMACSESAVLVSRVALIESVQVAMLLGATALLVAATRWTAAAAGLMLGLAMLTKVNSAIIAVVLGLWQLGELLRAHADRREILIRLALLVVVSAMVTGGVLGTLYVLEPQRFVAAYAFELDGVHFEELSRPLLRFGRFAIDPVLSARTVVSLFRESPFLWVLASLGLAIGLQMRSRAAQLFGLWLGLGSCFFLLQMYQPTRYFQLVLPAALFFGAQTLHWLGRAAIAPGASAGSPAPEARRVAISALCIVLCFELSYVAMNAVANPAQRARTVRAWAERSAPKDANVVAAGYLATDLPQRAYAHYHVLTDTITFADSLKRYDIEYVVWDDQEWQPHWRAILASRYERVAEFPFGDVYRVRDARGTSNPEPVVQREP